MTPKRKTSMVDLLATPTGFALTLAAFAVLVIALTGCKTGTGTETDPTKYVIPKAECTLVGGFGIDKNGDRYQCYTDTDQGQTVPHWNLA